MLSSATQKQLECGFIPYVLGLSIQLWPTRDCQIFTDASHIGWGMVLVFWKAQGFWNNQTANRPSNY